jgi:heme exporter protein C
MRHWWKALGIALLLAVVCFGLGVDIAPALVHVDHERIAPGPVELRVTSYRTKLSPADPPHVWISNDGQRVCASRVMVEDATHLSATVDVPAGLRAELTHLAVLPPDGDTLVLLDAFWTEGRGAGIADSPCTTGAVRSQAPGFRFPNRSLLTESIRNLFFHVPMWFTMMLLMTISVVMSVRHLRTGSLDHDGAALAAVHVGLLFAVLGLITGSIWARVTWGGWWTSDTKLNGAAVTTLVYAAYLVLRGSVSDPHKAARLAAVYNIFAYVLMMVFLMVLPRLGDSLHPGNGGNPAFNQYDLDDRLRLVFYPAVLGWMLLGAWAWTLARRLDRLQRLHDHA